MPEPEIRIVDTPISVELLKPLLIWHGTLVKGAADIRRGMLALGGEWHMDANTLLISDGSSQEDIWGFNIYPAEKGESAVELQSLINIRSIQGNKTMQVENPTIREEIKELVFRLIPELC